MQAEQTRSALQQERVRMKVYADLLRWCRLTGFAVGQRVDLLHTPSIGEKEVASKHTIISKHLQA